MNSHHIAEVISLVSNLNVLISSSGIAGLTHERGGVVQDSVKWLYDLRRRRDEQFGDDLFLDPSWDILLDLYVSKHNKKRISVTSACIASAAAPTTALRYIGMLEQRGLVKRYADPLDARRSFLDLSEEACEKMESIFRT